MANQVSTPCRWKIQLFFASMLSASRLSVDRFCSILFRIWAPIWVGADGKLTKTTVHKER